MRMSALVVMTMLLTAVGAQDSPPSAIEASSNKVKELQQERIAALKAVVEIGVKLTPLGHFDVPNLAKARMELLEAELSIAEKDADRIALYKEALEAFKLYEAMAKAAKEAARATELDKLMVKAHRLEIEIALEQATAKAIR